MLRQTLSPAGKIFFAGENISFELHYPHAVSGRAVVRTNLGRVSLFRREIIAHTEENLPVAGMDWHDIPMEKSADDTWKLTLPLTEVGTFEAKCCFIPDDGSKIKWPDGDNFVFKVEPAATVCANSIYSAFVRQFGERRFQEHSDVLPAQAAQLDKAGYTVIPPSGTFRNLIGELDHIFNKLNCRILQLLPVHPVPVQYGRMGRYGSPFAALDYFNVDPALAEFDEKATPMEQFGELIDAVHARNGLIFMDIPVNHTGWASKLQSEHPEYFVRKEDGTFESPGAWGVVWADLCKLNYDEPGVHKLMAQVFLFWCRRGVDGFRCDAGYMLPFEAWEYITAKVRSEYPDTIFLLEGLGGPVDKQTLLLEKAGLNWGYSELFQNYSRDEITRYQPFMEKVSHNSGTLISFAETHDNLRLASNGKVYAKLRFLVCSLLSNGSSFGFANGAEFFASEKIDVHGCGALNFGAEDNLLDLIGRINHLLAEHDCFAPSAQTTLVQEGGGNVIAATRIYNNQKLLILLNLDCHSSSSVYWKNFHTPADGFDLLSDEEVHFYCNNGCCSLELAPGQGRCIAFERIETNRKIDREPEKITSLRAALMAKKAVLALTGNPVCAGKCDVNLFMKSPEDFVNKYSNMPVPPLVKWSILRRDYAREVMFAPGDALLIEDKFSFICELYEADRCLRKETAVPISDGRFVVLLAQSRNDTAHEKTLRLSVRRFYPDNHAEHFSGKLILLPEPEKRQIRFSFDDVKKSGQLVFCSNSSGGYAMFPAAWGETNSKYEAILAANTDPRYPVDRRVLFSGMKAWLVTNDYSQEITSAFLNNFISGSGNGAKWTFLIPSGQGNRTALEVEFCMAQNGNAVRFKFVSCHHAGSESDAPAKLILRPALEDRINHELTKAFLGPEQEFPRSVLCRKDGFDFKRTDCTLSVSSSCGRFVSEPEWYYMCPLPHEAYYGLESTTDRFSPGYFEMTVNPESEVVLTACVKIKNAAEEQIIWQNADYMPFRSPEDFALESLRRFVVKRDDLSTVLAGYPWFLDWGRDTLIVLRGLVRLKEFREQAVRIIRAFAGFEREGSIPNVIRGAFESNRDTCDAPLYLIIAVRDFIDEVKEDSILNSDCSGRTLRQVLESIIRHYKEGTCNGIKMDEQSKLIYSPSHFSWMDTNYPAGTPRSGYPVEIQALWYAALEFMGEKALAAQVSASIEKYFFVNGHCSDCLHCSTGIPAEKAVADDHKRSNQLLLITLHAVKAHEKIHRILDDAAELLVPGGIRTIADEEVSFALPVYHHGRLLNDPVHPYRGKYCGPEDTERKVAYHNGTVWCWPFPAYCEALFIAGGSSVRKRALTLLMSVVKYFEYGAAGQLPEVADGDAPHIPGGCPAQAWSLSEFYRVYGLLKIQNS